MYSYFALLFFSFTFSLTCDDILPSIQFELELKKKKCRLFRRIFCFGWNTFYRKRFLSAVTCIFDPVTKSISIWQKRDWIIDCYHFLHGFHVSLLLLQVSHPLHYFLQPNLRKLHSDWLQRLYMFNERNK